MKNSGAILMPVPWKDELKEIMEGLWSIGTQPALIAVRQKGAAQ